jgi:hypothetical protein
MSSPAAVGCQQFLDHGCLPPVSHFTMSSPLGVLSSSLSLSLSPSERHLQLHLESLHR